MAPERYDSRRNGTWGHWVPLVVTLSLATAGVAAWAWSQRRDSDSDDDEPGLVYGNANANANNQGAQGAAGGYASQYDASSSRAHAAPSVGDETVGAAGSDVSGWGARMSGALRRTPSPQQFLDSTGKTVAAGFAAAGAAMGKALSSIREDDDGRGPYPDGNPWSEEADAKAERAPLTSPRHRKTVAIVVSADSLGSTEESSAGYFEHASILSHIPRHNDFSKIKLFVLIYTPELKDKDAAADITAAPPSLGSSYSNIGGNEQAQSPDEGKQASTPAAANTGNPAFNAVYSQALALVDKETMILPFTTPNGHVHILRHLQPEIVYLQESTAGDNGSIITSLHTWLRHDVVLVVGAEGGAGGLADSESEAEKATGTATTVDKWWQKPERVGRGRGIIVVDSMRVSDDWGRRVQGRE